MPRARRAECQQGGQRRPVEFRCAPFAQPATSGADMALMGLAGSRLSNAGVLVITARQHREQERNRADARARLAELIRKAATPPKPRRPTKIPGPASVSAWTARNTVPGASRIAPARCRSDDVQISGCKQRYDTPIRGLENHAAIPAQFPAPAGSGP